MNDIHLNGHHQRTLASIFRHPASHNVEWHDVLSLLGHLGTVSEQHNGAFHVTIGDHDTIVERPKGHDLEGDQLSGLKHFLAMAGLQPTDGASLSSATLSAGEDERTWIVLIDHHQARLFEVRGDSQHAASPIVFTPDDSDGSRRRVEHRQGNDDHDGGHASEDADYYERVCEALKPATRIIVLSDGKGRSSAGAYLVGHLKQHHAELAQQLAVSERVDLSHLSDGEAVSAGLAFTAAG